MIYVIVGPWIHWATGHPLQLLRGKRNGKEMESMTIDQINPKTGKVKEYQNSAEWLRDVEEATAKPPEKKPEVKTYVDASRRLREEAGIDLRSPDERRAAADAEFIEKKVAEGVAAALARQQVTQSPPVRQEAHSKPKSTNDLLAEFCQKIGWKPPKCDCQAHKQTPQTTIHSARGTGPVMARHVVEAGKPK